MYVKFYIENGKRCEEGTKVRYWKNSKLKESVTNVIG